MHRTVINYHVTVPVGNKYDYNSIFTFIFYRIEHLYSDVLTAVPFTIFAFIKPKLAVFTTPNVEFNILFPNFTTQFRHDDHKFEWTRKQFRRW